MNKRVRQIEENIQARKLLRRGDSILVAVSGGLDSMVLLNLLHEFSKNHKWQITVAHFNHQLRGRSSDADERLVQKMAANLNLQFVVERADVKKLARTNHISIEMAARKLRHEFLARTANKFKIRTIALAHHADDQVELFFLRLLRGSGSEGLSGMSWKSPSPADPSVQLVRPILDQPKEFLQAFARAKKLKFREDASNASLDFQRNRIRLEVVPLLKTMQPAVSKTVLRTMEIIATESSFVLAAASDWLSRTKRTPFDRLHMALQRVCLQLQVRALGLPADFELIEQLRSHPDCAVSVNAENSLYRDVAGTVYLRKENAISFDEAETKVNLIGQNQFQFGQRKFAWKFQNKEGAAFEGTANCEFFDAEKVGPKIILRHWKMGDRFQPIGSKSSKKLQDLFIDLKIPRAERHQRIVATTEHGEVFWVEGVRISERFKLDNRSQRRLKWTWQRL